MNNYLIVYFVLFNLIACSIKNNKIELSNNKISEPKIIDTLIKVKTTCELSNKSSVYIVDINKDGKEFLLKGDSLFLIKDNIDKIIIALNRKFKVKIKKIKISKNILSVKIINSKLFTQEIGDTDSNWYLASMVYSLTENERIKFVNVIFEVGDHGGVPGLKSRKSFFELYSFCN